MGVLDKYNGRDIKDLTAYFNWGGKRLECRIEGVSGRGSAHSYNVNIINIALGELHLTQGAWSFSTRKGHFDEVAEQLGKVILDYWIKYDQERNPLSRA